MFLFGLIPILNFVLIYLLLGGFASMKEGWRRKVFINASIIWGSLIVLGVEILNLFHAINFISILTFWVVLTGLSLILLIKFPPRSSMQSLFEIPSLSKLEINMLALTGFVIFLVGVVAFMAAPNSWDAVNYHMSRVAFWKQNHSVDHYPTPEFRQLFFQPWTGFSFLHFQILSGSDRFAPLVSWFSFAGSIIGVSLITLLLGGGRTAQIVAAFFAATIPTAITEASGVRIDEVISFWIICFVSLLLFIERKGRFYDVIILGFCTGLAALTKGTFFLMTPPFFIWLIFIMFRKFHWFKALKGFILIGLIALIMNAGFFYRNFELTGDFLGPASMRKWGLTENMTLPLMASNVFKTVAHQFGSAVPASNTLIIDAVYKIHDIFGIDAGDRRSTIPNSPFFVSSTTHEDSVSNLLQTILIIFSFIVVLAESLKSKRREAIYYILAVSAAFMILCISIKWTSHQTRYSLGLLILSSAVVALFFEKYLNSRKVVSYLLIFTLTLPAMPYVFRNNLRRLVSSKKQTVFNTPRIEQYFRNDRSLLGPYQKAVEEVRGLGCSQIGLYMGFNTWDYPLWVMMQKKFEGKFRMEHLLICDITQDEYPLGEFRPCALIAVYSTEEKLILGEQKFTKVKDFEKTAVYLPQGPVGGKVDFKKFSAL